jgi:zinc-ribbon family
VILIFGVRSRLKTIAEGSFFCPKCGADRTYRLQSIRRWFTLFFLPVFPVSGPQGEIVKCTTCGTAFRPDVLNTPTSAALTDLIRNAMRVAVAAVLRAGDRADATTRHAAINAVRGTGIEDYDDDKLAIDVEGADIGALPAYLTPLANGLNPAGKERFVGQVAIVAAADGAMSDAEHRVIETLGASFGLSAAYLTGIVATATAAHTDEPS